MVRKSDTYFNTTGESQEDALKYKEKNITQESRVLSIFKEQKKALTASQLWEIYGTIFTPLTSMRRALTNLVSARHLEKTHFKREGLYGRPEYFYKLAVSGSKSKKQNVGKSN